MIIRLLSKTGSFAEKKDVAEEIRIKEIIPALSLGEVVILDFEGITGTTQSFVHSLISDIIRQLGGEVFDRIEFKNCVPAIQKIIVIVTDYMQESTL